MYRLMESTAQPRNDCVTKIRVREIDAALFFGFHDVRNCLAR